MTTSENRRQMVHDQLRSRGIRDERVLGAMERVPRELFVPAEMNRYAYSDRPLAIGAGQTISQPYIVAVMCEAATIEAHDTVLEVGTGSAYAAAVLSLLAARVVTIERLAGLAGAAGERLGLLGYDNVELHWGDGTLGFAPAAPYSAIVVTAAGPELPPPLMEQLEWGGVLVMPLERRRGHQQLVAVTRRGPDLFEQRDVMGVAFVPLLGEFGWSPERAV